MTALPMPPLPASWRDVPPSEPTGPRPLLGHAVPRGLVATVVALAGCVGGIAATANMLTSMFSSRAVALSVVVPGVLLAAGALPTIFAILSRPRRDGRPEGVRIGGAIAVVAGLVLAAVSAIREAALALGADAELGLPVADAVVPIGVAAAAVFALAGVIAAIRWPIPRRVLVVASGVAIAVGACGTAAAVTVAATVDECAGFHVDPARWRDALAAPREEHRTTPGEYMAAAIVRCGTLDGMTRAQVRTLLGAPQGAASADRTDPWEWPVGTSGEFVFSQTVAYLRLRLGPDGRVRRAYVHHVTSGD